MAPQLPRIDAHCHLFNVFYLTSEVAQILWDKLWGNYPHRPEALRAAAGVRRKEIRDWLAAILKQISEVADSAFNSYEQNFQLLTNAYRKSFQPLEPIIVYPLMMDIYYMFADPSSAPPKATAAKGRGPFVKDPAKEFELLFDELRQAVIRRRDEILPARMQAMQALGAGPAPADAEAEMDRIYKGIIRPQDQGLRASFTDGIELSKAFEKQVWELIALRKAHPDCVFPFFAVDPRRIGIMDVVTKGRRFLPNEAPLVGPNGPFFGIKLYPRLGYTPQDVERLCPGFYGWCEDNEIPITLHCSASGFPPPPITAHNEFGDPDNWKAILETHPRLRVNFAHFGNNGKGWAEKIIDMMKKPQSRIFTDLACYTDSEKLKAVKTMLDEQVILKERLLFGTDFDVMLITDLIHLEEYFEQFKQVFSPGDLEAMSRIAPAAFLNLKSTQAPEQMRIQPALPGALDRNSRHAFIKRIRGENRFGWVRDLPDCRDFSVRYDNVYERQHKNAGQPTVKEMLSPVLRRAAEDPPAAVDLRPWCSPVEDQGAIGACTAHAAIALVEYFEIRTQQKHIDASRLFLYKVTRNLLDWQGDTGAYLRTAMEALVLFGVPPERYMPYVPERFDEEPSAFCYAFGQNFQTASYYRLDPLGTQPEDLLHEIKTSLAAGYPLMFGFTVYDSMGEAESSEGKVPFPSLRDRSVGGHAVAAVGYDDSVVIQNSEPGSLPTRGAILIRNSWGPDWGTGGYGWLPYEFVLKGLAVDWWTIIKQEWVDLDRFQ